MNDVEQDLRELFDRKAASVGGLAPLLPETVRKRSRRRELGTALASGAMVVALVLGSVAVLRAVGTRGTDRTPVVDPWAGYDVFERTATIETVTIVSPSDWYLVNQWPMSADAVAVDDPPGRTTCEITIPPEQESSGDEGCDSGAGSRPSDRPSVLPLALLSATDIGLGASPCLSGGIDLTDDEAVFEVAIDTEAVDRIEAGEDLGLPAWPVGFDEATTSGPCGEGRYARFQVGRYPYIAFTAWGRLVSDDDREMLLTLASQMRIDEEAFIQGTPNRTPAYVIAGGENATGPWRLELRDSDSEAPSANVSLTVVSPEGGADIGDFTVPTVPIEQAGGDPVFGAVTKDAAGVEIRLEEGTPPIPAQIVPLPPTMPFDFDIFFASNDADVQAKAVALGMSSRPQETPVPSPISRQVWRSGVLSLNVLETPGSTCLRVKPYGFEQCVDGDLSGSTPILQLDPVEDLSERAFMLWGAVPSSVGQLEIRAGDYDRIQADITHPTYEGIKFVVYVAPWSGDACDVSVGFLDVEGRSIPLRPTCPAESAD